MKEFKGNKPILFSTPMVQAILDGRKTQTRRVIKSKHESGLFFVSKTNNGQVTGITSLDWDELPKNDCTNDIQPICKVGDVLWVRETWQYSDDLNEPYLYKQKFMEEYHPEYWDMMKWKPSIFMPKEACRIFLRVKNIRAERLHDISENDAINEGVQPLLMSGMQLATSGQLYRNYMDNSKTFNDGCKPLNSFMTLWQSINGTESWSNNPWVWVYEFELINEING